MAASIVGTARRNENSTIVVRLSPRNSPPRMVAPALFWQLPPKLPHNQDGHSVANLQGVAGDGGVQVHAASTNASETGVA